MQLHRAENPNRVEADLFYQDARRQGCTATRGALNLGEAAPFGHYRPEPPPERGPLLVVVAVVVLALSYGCYNFVAHVLNEASARAAAKGY